MSKAKLTYPTLSSTTSSVKLMGPTKMLTECLQDFCSLFVHPATPLAAYTGLKNIARRKLSDEYKP